MKAFLKNYHQSPRKTRLVADLIKGKPVTRALAELDLTIKKSSAPLKKLILSAVANAKHNSQAREEDLYIKNITVDKGNVIKRSQPRARGRAFPIRHRLSHVEVVLGTKIKPLALAKTAK